MGPDDNLKQNVRQSWADGQRWRSMSRFKGRTGAPPNTVYRLHAVRRNNVRWCRRTQISNVYIAGPAAGAVSRRVKYRGGKGGQTAARRQNRGPQCQGGTAQLGIRARAPEHFSQQPRPSCPRPSHTRTSRSNTMQMYGHNPSPT